MPTEVIDFSQKKGKIRPVKNTVLKYVSSTNSRGINPFLKEVKVSNTLRCCYLSTNRSLDFTKKEHYFDIAQLKLPAGFEYVDYLENNTDTPDWSNKKGSLEKHINTPLLINLRDKNRPSREHFHICENFETSTGLYAKTSNGCAELVLPNAGDIDFVAFYYKGELLFSDSENGPERSDENYLIPMVLSEGTIVYWAIQVDKSANKNHEAILAAVRESIQAEPELINNIGIIEKLQYNDKPGIFVTRVVSAGVEPVLNPLPYSYDLFTLERK